MSADWTHVFTPNGGYVYGLPGIVEPEFAKLAAADHCTAMLGSYRSNEFNVDDLPFLARMVRKYEGLLEEYGTWVIHYKRSEQTT
jgi:hypothetical protein